MGIIFLALAKAKHTIKGYSSPKPFGVSEVDKCIEYDIKVVDGWLSHLEKYINSNSLSFLVNKNVLELGPGSDLGTGIYLLSMGCAQYNACDVNDLIKNTPNSFYLSLLKKLGLIVSSEKISFLEKELGKLKSGTSSKLSYVVRNDFDFVAEFGTGTIDIVFSQAAFEHFDDIEETIEKLSMVCKNEAILIAVIDLRTHSRWIRNKDPNNIYRYSDDVYKFFWFRGIPNRIRPYQYKEALERFGWKDILIIPSSTVSTKINMDRAFMDHKNEMDVLSIILCARK